MSEFEVLVTDHDFEDLDIEREVLVDLATVRALNDIPGGIVSPGARCLAVADGIINLRSPLEKDVIDQLDSCQIIARYGTGVDNVDVDAASSRGIIVTNVPEYCVEEVALHALGMSLSLVRHLKRYDAAVGEGVWDRSAAPAIRRFSELTVGVVGFGAIGQAFGRNVAALGAKVVASDPYLEPADLDDVEAELVEFDSLLEGADLVSIHTPLTEETHGLVDERALERMKPTAYLVNVARGGLVDEASLASALDAGEIAGAGLDVLEDESAPGSHPLADRQDVVLTPHVAWYSEEANDERRRVAAENVRAVLLGERPAHPVNDIPDI